MIPIETFKTHNYMLVDFRQDSVFMDMVEKNLKMIEDRDVLEKIDENKFNEKDCNSLLVWTPKYVAKKKNGSFKFRNEMKYIGLTLLSIVWLLSTLLLAITFIGILVFFIEDENDEIYWFVYGRKLIDGLSA